MQRLPLSDPHLEEVSAQSSNPDLLSAPSFTISTSKAIISHRDPDSNPTVYSDETGISSVIRSHAARGIGSYYFNPSTFTDEEKFDLLCNVWKPGPDYCFPLNSLGHRFQQKWLDQFSWLAYSDLLDGAFCLNCMLFGGESGHNASKLVYLYKSPFDKWSKAMEKLQSPQFI